MKTILLLSALLTADLISISSTETGVKDANLSATPTTAAINTEATLTTNQLSLMLAVTPGTTTVVDVKCYESQNNTDWALINVCDTTAPKRACVPDVRSYTLANYVGTVKYIASVWSTSKKYVKCSADDAADGSGTVTITATRSFR